MKIESGWITECARLSLSLESYDGESSAEGSSFRRYDEYQGWEPLHRILYRVLESHTGVTISRTNRYCGWGRRGVPKVSVARSVQSLSFKGLGRESRPRSKALSLSLSLSVPWRERERERETFARFAPSSSRDDDDDAALSLGFESLLLCVKLYLKLKRRAIVSPLSS